MGVSCQMTSWKFWLVVIVTPFIFERTVGSSENLPVPNSRWPGSWNVEIMWELWWNRRPIRHSEFLDRWQTCFFDGLVLFHPSPDHVL